jgi:hypothetical protein
MKTAIFSLFLMLMGFGLLSAQNTTQNALVGRAHQEVGQCVGRANRDFSSPILHRVDVVGSCFVSGFLYRVTFYHVTFGTPCVPTEENPCVPPLPLYQGIATVDFDCVGNIIGSECLYQR